MRSLIRPGTAKPEVLLVALSGQGAPTPGSDATRLRRVGAERGDRGAARPGSRGSRRVLGAAPVDAAADLYRLVAGGYPKTDNAYSRLGKHLAKARRAELIGFDAIRDDGITRAAGFGERYGDESPEDYIDGVRDRLRVALAVNSYRRGAHEDQPHHIAVWCEAAGMVPQLARAVGRYGVDVWSCGGTDSLTAKKRMADRICRRGEPSVLLHIGDYDRHGLIIFDALAEDLEESIAELTEAAGGKRAKPRKRKRAGAGAAAS